jgi:hypothetical protein
MELTRLKELMESRSSTLAEESKHDKAFNGIRGVVEDALADLSDKLGKGGNLATLMKDSGASKLDTVKDSDGKNVLKQIMELTATYKKAVEKLMTEAEMLVMQVNEGQLNEGKDYADSAEFTDEFYSLFDLTTKMKTIMKNPRWMKWMKTTDNNSGVETEDPALGAIDALNNLEAQLRDVDAELDKAS